jgi:hypothetical protein
VNILHRLFGPHEPDDRRLDDTFPILIKVARRTTDEAWQVVNESRRRRGEPLIDPPRWDDLLQQPDGDGA